MKVENVKVYDLEESLHASGYPLRTTTNWTETEEATLKRAKNLSHAADWVGAHDQFLTGILVSFDLTFSNKAWVEAERYRFLSFVSSESTMHRITKFNLKEQCNRYVDARIIDIVQRKIDEYNRLSSLEGQDKERESQKKELYLEILYNIPAGFELTARLTTNYRCLKNIWRQRRDHRLPEWREFCEWIETLPYAKDLICYEKEKDNKVPESTSMDEIMKRLNYLETELQKISFIKQISNSNPLFQVTDLRFRLLIAQTSVIVLIMKIKRRTTMTLYKKTEELITLSENEAKETIEAYRQKAREEGFQITSAGYTYKTKKQKGIVVDEIWVCKIQMTYCSLWGEEAE